MVLLLNSYKPEYQSHGYLNEVIVTTHLYLLQVDNLTKQGVIPMDRMMEFVKG